MNKKKIQIQNELTALYTELESALTNHQTIKDELENFLSQFTCVLDAPSCGCSEEELNDPGYDALFTEQDRLTKLLKVWTQRINELQSNITSLKGKLKTLD